MSEPKKQQGPSKIHMLAPAAFVVIGYGYFFHISLQQEMGKVDQRLTKLYESQSDTEQELADTAAATKSAQKTTRDVEEDLSAARSVEKSLVRRSNNVRADLTRASRPAATMQTVIGLLERHRLEVLNSGPTGSSARLAQDAVKPLIDLLSDAAGKTAASRAGAAEGREVYEVRMRGRFGDFRDALDDLAGGSTDVLPLSFEMESMELDAATAEDGRRTWRLILLV